MGSATDLFLAVACRHFEVNSFSFDVDDLGGRAHEHVEARGTVGSIVCRHVPHVMQVWRYESIGEAYDNEEKQRPWWFYFPNLFVMSLPWTPLWLAGIVINLLTNNPPQYYDIALRDFGLMLGALTLTRLAWAFARKSADAVGTEPVERRLRLRRAA